MNRTKLIADVRHILDEQELVQDPELEYGDNDSIDISSRIDVLFAGSFNEFGRIAPLQMMEESDLPTDGLADNPGDGTGSLPLPADYLRLGTFKMRGWKREVHAAIDDLGEDYQLQLCGATRGGVKNPVVAVCADRTRLEYYSLPRGAEPHQIEKATYVKKAGTIADTELKESGYEAFVWWLAREVAITFKTQVEGINNILKEKLNGY